MDKRMLVVVAVTLAAIHTNAVDPGKSIYEAPQHLEGTILETPKTGLLPVPTEGTVLFKFKRQSQATGTNVVAIREFTTPKGELTARETVTYEGNRLAKLELEETQTGGKGIVAINHDTGTVEFSYQKDASSSPKTAREKLLPNTICGDMIPVLISTHWSALTSGQEVKTRFLAIDRRETVGFTFAKSGEDKDTVTIKMTPTSLIIAAIVDPLFFIVEKKGEHRILAYAGRVTPKTLNGSKWKELDAYTIYQCPDHPKSPDDK